MNSSSGYTYNLCVEGVTDIIVSVFYVFRLKFARPHTGGVESLIIFCVIVLF